MSQSPNIIGGAYLTGDKAGAGDDAGFDLVIGLVNNMPKPALKSTELEFRTLLKGAAPGWRVHLRCFVFPGTAAPGPHYEPLDVLFDKARDGRPLDGLIVTGTEPIADRLDDEPYWADMTRLVDWASLHTVSTIWSCLAAQSAVLRLDGIVRRPLPQKISGVYECVKVSDHALLADAPAHWPVPHSRLNDIDEFVLAESGYQILSRAPQIGADSFLKQAGDSLFLMLQGHPEYGADCLLREYRRDIRRYRLGQRPHFPQLPQRYFEPAVTRRLLELRDRAASLSTAELLSLFDAAVQPIPQASWHQAALRLYAKWLGYIAAHKPARCGRADAGLVAT